MAIFLPTTIVVAGVAAAVAVAEVVVVRTCLSSSDDLNIYSRLSW